MPCDQSLAYIHPYLHPMHALRQKECVLSHTGRVLLPCSTKLKYDEMAFDGLYVMDTARKIYVVVGPQLPPRLFDECFVASTTNSNEMVLREDYRESVDDLGYRLSLILDELRYDR